MTTVRLKKGVQFTAKVWLRERKMGLPPSRRIIWLDEQHYEESKR